MSSESPKPTAKPKPDHDEIRLRDVERLRLEPGDTLLVTVPADMDAEQVARLTKWLSDWFPGNRSLVLQEGVSVQVVTRSQRR